MPSVIPIALVIAGIIHLLPAVGVLSADRLHALYGIRLADDTMVLLVRHRAVLFGLLGTFFVYAASVPAYHSLAISAGLVSVLSFLMLARPASAPAAGWPRAIRVVIQADILALVCLFAAAAAHVAQMRGW